jgi:hypothetical protein
MVFGLMKMVVFTFPSLNPAYKLAPLVNIVERKKMPVKALRRLKAVQLYSSERTAVRNWVVTCV